MSLVSPCQKIYGGDHKPCTRILLEATGRGSKPVDNGGNVMGIDLELDPVVVPKTCAG